MTAQFSHCNHISHQVQCLPSKQKAATITTGCAISWPWSLRSPVRGISASLHKPSGHTPFYKGQDTQGSHIQRKSLSSSSCSTKEHMDTSTQPTSSSARGVKEQLWQHRPNPPHCSSLLAEHSTWLSTFSQHATCNMMHAQLKLESGNRSKALSHS